uniref:Cadherin domain-containing protein n=1 Tax=Lates calcarifer TaxID=8187 RepID=A0A4W6BZQ4_LATCA
MSFEVLVIILSDLGSFQHLLTFRDYTLYVRIYKLMSRSWKNGIYELLLGILRNILTWNLKTGALYVCDRIDREELCPNTAKCSLNIEAILSHPMQLHRIEVQIIDINDNAPSFRENEKTLNISESSFTGERYLLPMANDADTGSNSVKSYKLSANEGNFNPETLFSINPDTGEITVTGKVDYEEHTAYDIRVQARDRGTPSRSVHGKVLVEVTDVNDNIPEIIITSLMSPVKENAEIGTVVALVTVTDKDGGNNGLTRCHRLWCSSSLDSRALF